MGSKYILGVGTLVVLMLAGYGSATFEQDKAECVDKLVGLATCLSYVGGTAKAPTVDCCTGLKQVLTNSKKCLCILIKDRDNPNLGFKVNVTLAASLPSACKAPANLTQCIDLLKLPPSSPDAKVFAGFANLTQAIPTKTGNTSSSSSSGSSAEDKSDGGKGKTSRWIGMDLNSIVYVINFPAEFGLEGPTFTQCYLLWVDSHLTHHCLNL
ncbi:Bifunctional inhibitor/lipid-transfer protein/seed storage 2S albumin superfamily protein [Euphorbia peplus]|nr:Bifunctional inhibitor/lipid-transfer protein/seed storage 2S albumin superfamily protein [Euphorbia peplus]